jgi:dynamin 1-like protein
MNNQGGAPGQNQGNNPNNPNQMNNNDMRPQPPIDAKTIFIKEIRNRIEAYFKLIVRNLRDSIPKIIGNHLIKEIEENMQIKLYNKLYNAREITDLLNEPENVAERRKELNDMIKVMKNAQKIIRKDPDLMNVMQININDSDITSSVATQDNKNKKDVETEQKIDFSKTMKPTAPKQEAPPKLEMNKNQSSKKLSYGNLFG